MVVIISNDLRFSGNCPFLNGSFIIRNLELSICLKYPEWYAVMGLIGQKTNEYMTVGRLLTCAVEFLGINSLPQCFFEVCYLEFKSLKIF